MQRADGMEYTGSPKSDLRVMTVAEVKGGLREYAKQDRLNIALTNAATELQYTTHTRG